MDGKIIALLSTPMKGISEIRNEKLCVTMYYLVHFRCASNLPRISDLGSI
jgi:hypothetical protein